MSVVFVFCLMFDLLLLVNRDMFHRLFERINILHALKQLRLLH